MSEPRSSSLVVCASLVCGAVLAAASIAACSGDAKPAVAPAAEPRAASAPAVVESEPVAPSSPRVDDGVDRKDDGTLLLEDVPELPDAFRQQAAGVLGYRSARLVGLSDNGRSLLVSSHSGPDAQLQRVKRPLAAPAAIELGKPLTGDALLAPGGKVIHLLAENRRETNRILRVDLATGAVVTLTDGALYSDALLWSRDGKQLVYRSRTASDARHRGDSELWISDGERPSSARRLLAAQGRWQPLDWSFDGKKLLVRQWVSSTDLRIHVVDVASGAITRLSPDPAASYAAAVFARDGKTVYVTSDREGEFKELYLTDLRGKSWRSLTRKTPWDVGALTISRTGRQLAFVTNEAGVSVLRVLDTRSKRVKLLPTPRGVIRGLRFARKADVLGFSLSASASPGEVYSYDLSSKKAARKAIRWTDSQPSGHDHAGFIEPSTVEYVSFDGAKIPALYYRPVGDGPFPVVIVLQRAPLGQARPEFAPLPQLLARELGFAVISANLRGASGLGKSFMLLDNGMKRADAVKDIGALLDWVAGRKELDATRVGLQGDHYGGYLVLASLATFAERIKAGASFAGFASFTTYLHNSRGRGRELDRAEYGDERNPAMKSFFDRIAPAASADKINSALFIAQGAGDPRVPTGETEALIKVVRKQGLAVWYMLARDEAERFSKPSNQQLRLLLTSFFLQQSL